MNNKIPKTIHQIWMQGEKNITPDKKENIKNIKNLHTGWIYILWDETMIVGLLNRDKELLKKYYNFIYLHQKVDFAKILILYYFGGIYIDFDCILLKNLDPLFIEYKEYDLIVSYLSDKISYISNYITCSKFSQCINNGIIISKKNKDICNYLLDNFKTDCSYYDTKFMCITNTTGPNIFNHIIDEYQKNNGQDKILILSSEYFEPCVLGDCNVTDNTYIEHRHELSWFSDGQKKILNFFYDYEYYIFFTIIIIIIFIVYKFFGYKFIV